MSTCRRDDGNRKVSVSKPRHHHCGSESSMVAKVTGWKYDEKQDVYVVSPTRYVVTAKGNTVTLH